MVICRWLGFFVLSLVLLLELAFVVVFVTLCWLPGSSCALWLAFTVFGWVYVGLGDCIVRLAGVLVVWANLGAFLVWFDGCLFACCFRLVYSFVCLWVYVVSGWFRFAYLDVICGCDLCLVVWVVLFWLGT